MTTIRKNRKIKKLQGLSKYLSTIIIGGAIIIFSGIILIMYSVLDDEEESSSDNNDTLEMLQQQRQYDRSKRRRRRTVPNEGGVRQRYEDKYHKTDDEIREDVKKMRLPHPVGPFQDIQGDIPYDVHHCPPEVPDGYPVSWNVLEVLYHWHPDDTDVPEKGIYQGLCAIDWSDHEHRTVAYRYQKAEVPFLIHNHFQIWQTAERWSHYEYVHELVGDGTHRNEHNKDGNHMMYWKLGKRNINNNEKPDDWTQPTDNVELNFQDWYTRALNVEHSSDPIHTEHYYLRLNGLFEHENDYLYDELPFFEPSQSSLFMVDPDQERGINCRFGSKGIIAEAHYDMSRNMILVLNGRKRYILAHPEECLNMELYPIGHPSARHSRVNWSDPQSWETGNFPKGQMNEVVLQAGDALYLPTFCGITLEYQDYIHQCGF